MTRYQIAPERSQVWIDARSSVHPIHARTAGLEGFVDVTIDEKGRVDLSEPATARLSLPVTRLKAGNPLEDRELKRRILAREFPSITGELHELASGEDGDASYTVTGVVCFRGETQTYTHSMDIRAEGDTLRLSGEAVFDVRDFGMEPPRILMLKVEPEVTVRVEIVAVEDDPDA